MNEKPLTEFQQQVLSEIFRTRASSPRSIAGRINKRLPDVCRAIGVLRAQRYIGQDPAFYQGARNSNASFRPLKTLGGTPVEPPGEEKVAEEVEKYLETHEVTKCPPAAADGIHHSQMWEYEL